jgi:hypothetical protein
MRTKRAIVATCGLALAFSLGCSSPYKKLAPGSRVSPGVVRLTAVPSFVMAFETTPVCKLEVSSSGDVDKDSRWQALAPNELAGRRFEVLDRRAHKSQMVLALHVREMTHDGGGPPIWIRNPAAATTVDQALAWRCAVPTDAIKDGLPQNKAKHVRLDTERGTCSAIHPIIGTRDDVTLSPYTVVGLPRLFAGRPPTPQEAEQGKLGAITIGITLEAEGGQKHLTVPSPDFDRCFAPADRPPPPPDEAAALLEWLTGESPDTEAPPGVSLETVESVAGISKDRCKSSGSGKTSHLECRTPVLRITPMYDRGPFGPKTLQLTRQRLVDAMHIYGNKLVPPTEIIEVNAVVRMPKVATASAFSKAFNATLGASMEEPKRRLARAARGFRLLRQADASGTVQPTHYVDLELTPEVPELETTVESRVHKYIAGKKKVDNPEYPKAEEAVANAKDGVESAKQAAELAKATAEQAKVACDQLSGLAAVGCNAGLGAAGSGIGMAAVTSAQTKLTEATSKLASTTKQILVDDERTYEYQAKILRRKGAAVAKVSIAPAGSTGAAPFTSTITVPFDASDVEVPDVPEHKLKGKQAKPPTVEDTEKALAEALLPKIDEMIIKWGAQRQVGGDLGEMVPGSRSWMVGVARRAANDRPIKLLNDLLENRKDVLELPLMIYPVYLPKGSENRCYTFAAIPLDGRANVNLQFGVKPPEGSKRMLAVGKDSRTDPDAAFEVCNVKPGREYAVGVSFNGARSAKGVLVALFDTTPGAVTDEDTRKATRGIPNSPRKADALVLDGEGKVRHKSTEGAYVTGQTGDRDGDGVDDEQDRCPYERENKNGYLDNDGCPDERPVGWTAPEESAPATPATPEPSPAAPAPAPKTAGPLPVAKNDVVKSPSNRAGGTAPAPSGKPPTPTPTPTAAPKTKVPTVFIP